MRVLITGGAGFIGSHTAETFMRTGHEVVIVDDLSGGHAENVPSGAEFRSEDLFDALASNTLGPLDAIVHLAAIPSVQASLDRPLDTHRANYVSTLAVAEFARLAGVRRVLFASSAAVYGTNTELPLREDSRTQPISPYGVDKLSSENLLRVYRDLYGIETVSARFFNVYGTRQSPDSPYSGVISIFLNAVVQQQTIKVFGDGTQSRDFISVQDVAQAILGLIESTDTPPPVVNVCTGRAISLTQLLAAIGTYAPKMPQIDTLERRSGDIRHSCGDPTQLKSFLPQWVPAEFLEGIKDLVEQTLVPPTPGSTSARR